MHYAAYIYRFPCVRTHGFQSSGQAVSPHRYIQYDSENNILTLLMLSLAVMISLCHADMRLPGYLSWNVSCDGAAIRPYHGRA